MWQIVRSAEVDIQKSCDLLWTIHTYFSTFQNKYLPFTEASLQYDSDISPLENCDIAIGKIKQMLKLIKDSILFPNLNKISTLLELAKLTVDLKECIMAYVTII